VPWRSDFISEADALTIAGPLSQTREAFLSNRARGRVALAVAPAGGVPRRRCVAEEGSLRVRFPGRGAGDSEAVIVNVAGGIAGGDRFDLDIRVEQGAALTVTTAAAEKVYRSLGPEAHAGVRLRVAREAALCWLPQETILFDGARFRRGIDVDVMDGGRLLLAESLVFGRTAMGEVVRHGSLTDRWRVRHDGRLALADTVRLGDAVADVLAEPAVAAGGAALATVLAVPGCDAFVQAVRGRAAAFHSEVAASAWNGIALARIVAPDGAALRRDVIAILAALGTRLPRLWLN
jgi:urease accessory protein